LRSTATIAAVLVVSLVFVLGLVTLLSYFKFESSLTTITERRIDLVVERARESIESVMRLGLKLEDIEALRGIVEEAKTRDARIETIHVFRTDNARNVFSSDPAAIDASVASHWLAAQAASPGGNWRIQSGNSAIVGRRLDSSIAEGVGGFVVVYSLADVIARIEAMRGRLLVAAAATVAAFAMIALVSAPLITRGFRRTLGNLADALGAARGSRGAHSGLPDSLRQSVEEFHETARHASHELDRLEAMLAGSGQVEEPRMAARA
jgi:hypothetical protein